MVVLDLNLEIGLNLKRGECPLGYKNENEVQLEDYPKPKTYNRLVEICVAKR